MVFCGAKDVAPIPGCIGLEDENVQGGRRNRRSFDCGSRDETARAFAQDDNFYIDQILTLAINTLANPADFGPGWHDVFVPLGWKPKQTLLK
jgi:hypothetical protein